MSNTSTKIRMLLKQFDDIIDQTDDEKRRELEILRKRINNTIKNISVQFVIEAINYYLNNLEDEPFYQSVRELDKSVLAKKLKRSRSYVYNALRYRNFNEDELKIIHSLLDENL